MAFIRNNKGLTLPFALLLSIIFASLVGVAYLFVFINLKQMRGNLQVNQAIVLAEGINEVIKIRLNKKQLPKLTEEEQDKLKDIDDEFSDEEKEDLFDAEDFNEETELFSEYYADEVVKISRYITFRNPPEPEAKEEKKGRGNLAFNEEEGGEDAEAAVEEKPKPEDYVATLGNIVIPEGTMLTKGTKLIVYRNVMVDLKQDDITLTNTKQFKDKLPVPTIKSLSPNYAEVGSVGSITVIGENLDRSERASFSDKDIKIEDIKGGPVVDFKISNMAMTGLTNFSWDSSRSEFYVLPKYDGSNSPVIDLVQNSNNEEFIEINAGGRIDILNISGFDLYLNKSLPVIVPDSGGIKVLVKKQAPSKNSIAVSISVDKNVSPGIHSFFVATEGGFSNSWVFNVLPEGKEVVGNADQIATYSSALTLVDIKAVEELLPLIDEDEDDLDADEDLKEDEGEDSDDLSEGEEDDEDDPFSDEDEIAEKDKLGAFANTDLETRWILETSVMIGKITRTVSEVIERRIPIVKGAVLCNGMITFNGGAFKILGATNAMTKLVEPTYVVNTELRVEGPGDEDDLRSDDLSTQMIQTPAELGFTEDAYVAVYKAGATITELDYSVISMVGENSLSLYPPGLMDFHYEDDDVFQFVPPSITGEKIDEQEAERHLVPKDYALHIPYIVDFKKIFGPNIDQYSELADLYTNDATIPKDNLDLPVGFMGLTYLDTTAIFGENNNLIGKGVIIIDTRSDNLGKADGTVEITGDSRNPAEFNGIVYVKGNLRLDGYITINGALIVDNDSNGQIEVASNAIGMITYDEKAIKQTILSIPFSSKPGSVKISSKELDLSQGVISGEENVEGLGSTMNSIGIMAQGSENSAEESLIQPATPIQMNASTSGEEELIKFFD